jgi:hypothetical protein
MSVAHVAGKPVYLVLADRFAKGVIKRVDWATKTIFCLQEGNDSEIQYTESREGYLKDVLDVKTSGVYNPLYATEISKGDIHFGMGTIDVTPSPIRLESLHRRTPFHASESVDVLNQSSWSDVLSLSEYNFMEVERDIDDHLRGVFVRPSRGVSTEEIQLLDTVTRFYRGGMPKAEILVRINGVLVNPTDNQHKVIDAIKHLSR